MSPGRALWRGARVGTSASRWQGATRMQMRFNSSSSEATTAKTVSPHIGFYQKFGRAIFKVLLMAALTYQIAYWGWVRLEKDEIKRIKSAELRGLEKQLEELTKDKRKP